MLLYGHMIDIVHIVTLKDLCYPKKIEDSKLTQKKKKFRQQIRVLKRKAHNRFPT